MSYAATLVRLLPLALLARVAMTLTQIVVAVIVVTGSVVLGHDLRDWRAWYAEPGTTPPFAPADWSSPVLVVTGSADGDTASVVVISWQARRVVELFRAGGKRLEVSSDGRGWPRIVVTSTDGAVSRVHTYAWNGSAFATR